MKDAELNPMLRNFIISPVEMYGTGPVTCDVYVDDVLIPDVGDVNIKQFYVERAVRNRDGRMICGPLSGDVLVERIVPRQELRIVVRMGDAPGLDRDVDG